MALALLVANHCIMYVLATRLTRRPLCAVNRQEPPVAGEALLAPLEPRRRERARRARAGPDAQRAAVPP